MVMLMFAEQATVGTNKAFVFHTDELGWLAVQQAHLVAELVLLSSLNRGFLFFMLFCWMGILQLNLVNQGDLLFTVFFI